MASILSCSWPYTHSCPGYTTTQREQALDVGFDVGNGVGLRVHVKIVGMAKPHVRRKEPYTFRLDRRQLLGYFLFFALGLPTFGGIVGTGCLPNWRTKTG